MKKFESISIVGAGRAGTAFAVAAHSAGLHVAAVQSRTGDHARELARKVGAAVVPTVATAMRAADLTIVAVSDAAVVSVSAGAAATGISLRERAIIHCSGVQSREDLAALRQNGAAIGMLHPLVALAPGASASAFADVTFSVDADDLLLDPLGQFVHDLGGRMVAAPKRRDLYHAAAVLAGNAPLALLAAARDVMVRAGFSSEDANAALTKLAMSAIGNAQRLGAEAALTGPVARGDIQTVAKHLEALRTDPHLHSLYATLTEEMARMVPPNQGDVARDHAA